MIACLSAPCHAAQDLFSIPHPVPISNPWYTWASTRGGDGESALTFDNFQIGQSSFITEVSWVGCYIDQINNITSPPAAPTTNWEIHFYANNAGAPGALVHSVTIPAANVTSTHVSFETFVEEGKNIPVERRRYSAILTAPAVLAGGTTYWFSPRSIQPVFNPHFSWMGGPGGTGECHQIRNRGGGPPEIITRPDNRAFTLRGDPTPGISLQVAGNPVASGGSAGAGNLNLGFETTLSVRISNPGPGILQNVAASILPAGGADFRIGDTPPAATVAAGSSTTFNVVFSPQALGQRNATLQVASNAPAGTYVIQLSGTGIDTIDPVISPQANFITIVDGAEGNAAAVNAWLANRGGASATDNSGSVTWTHNFTALPIPGEAVTVTFTATDPSGNQSVTSAPLRVLDLTPPVIGTPPSDLAVLCDDPDRDAIVTAWLAGRGGAQATDNSGSVQWSNNFTAQPGPCGEANIIFTAKDPSNNSSTATARLTIVDATAPVIATPASALTVESDGNGNVAARNEWLNSHGGASATDNCSAVSWSHDFTGLANTLPQTVPVTFSASDACGNATSTTAFFTIQDTTPPQIVAPAKDFYGDCDDAAADMAAFLASNGSATAHDIAGPVTWSHDWDATLPDCKGHIAVTFTATDTVGLTASTSARFFLFPPGAIWIGPETGTWPTPTAWRSQVPTAALDAYVDLFDFQNTKVTVPGTANVKNLFIGEGDEVYLDGASLNVRGTLIENAGAIRMDGGRLFIYGPTSLEGTGRMTFQGSGANLIERGNGLASDILTVGEDQELTTAADTVAEYQRTAIRAGLVNRGTVTADEGGLMLYNTPKTNEGTFRAINGGDLKLNGTIHNAEGTIFAGADSTVSFMQGTLNGGLVTGPGTLLADGTTATVTGPITLDSDLTTTVRASSVYLHGGIANQGLLTIGSPAGNDTCIVYVHGAVPLEGTGKVLIQGSGRRQFLRGNSSPADVLTVAAGQEIVAGAGTVAEYQNAAIHSGLVNRGVVTADAGGLILYNTAKTNEGTFRAINGGDLRLNGTIDNAAGIIFADAGSTVRLQHGNLNGGLVTGPGTLLADGTNATLTGPITLDSGLITAIQSSYVYLHGEITNQGLMTVGSPSGGDTCIIYLHGAVSMEGTGKILIQGSGRRQFLRGNSSPADVLTVPAGQEIVAGAGTTADPQHTAIPAGLVNHGTLTADAGGLILHDAPKTNQGAFRAINGGNLVITASILTNYNLTTRTLTGGRWEAVTSGAATTVNLSGATINHLAAGTTVRLSGAAASIPALSSLNTIAGTLALENGKTLATAGNLAIPGTLEYGLPAEPETTRLSVTGSVDFTGTTIHVRDLGLETGSYLLANWTGSVTGSPVLGSLPAGSRHQLVLDAAAKTLRLEVVVTPPAGTSGVTITSFTVTPATGGDAGKNIISISAQGEPDISYEVEASTDLKIWTPVSPVLTSPTGTLEWEFLQDAGFPRRFYRFRTP